EVDVASVLAGLRQEPEVPRGEVEPPDAAERPQPGQRSAVGRERQADARLPGGAEPERGHGLLARLGAVVARAAARPPPAERRPLADLAAVAKGNQAHDAALGHAGDRLGVNLFEGRPPRPLVNTQPDGEVRAVTAHDAEVLAAETVGPPGQPDQRA